ncbi:RNA polymerase sigma factor [Lacibacter sp. H407]|uniref:RNA polymerase sigma factor n=1 Tax=Lacibacter sp. H407 TaxID=3133423 RepID=UPI0030BFAE97
MKPFDEIELMERLKRGDQQAFLTLYDRYHPLVYNWVLKLVKVPELAEDIVQEVFIKIWQIKERLNPEQSFPAFLYKISRNQAFALLKKIASDETLRSKVMTELGSNAESAENRLLWQQYEKLLNHAVEQLPVQRKKVFKLCRQEGMSYEEVATELGISRNTVKEHMVMAMKNIREYFSQHGDMSLLFLFLLTQKP